jgi:hypothetical protein
MLTKFKKDLIFIYLSIWLHLSSIIFIYKAGLSPTQQQVLILLSLPVFVYLFLKKSVIDYGVNKKILILFLILVAIFLAGIFHESSLGILARSLNFFYLCILGILLSVKIKYFIPKLFYYYSIIGIVTLLVCFGVIYGIKYRTELAIHPNFIGMIVLSIILSSLYIKSKIFTLIIYLLSFTVLIIVSSRAAILCVVLIMFLDFFFFKKIAFFNLKSKLAKFLLIIFYTVIFIYFGYEIINNLFLLDDKYRGLNSGFTGRDVRWLLAFDKWLENFWLGVGYGESINFIGFSIDNAYLTILLEIGFFGMITYLFMVLYSLITYYKNKKYYEVLFIIIYLLYGIFEKRYFSVGNSFSIIFIFLIFSITNSKYNPIKERE